MSVIAFSFAQIHRFPPTLFAQVGEAFLALDGAEMDESSARDLGMLAKALGLMEGVGQRFVWETAHVFQHVLERVAEVSEEGIA